jgi:hypothetical protein
MKNKKKLKDEITELITGKKSREPVEIWYTNPVTGETYLFDKYPPDPANQVTGKEEPQA